MPPKPAPERAYFIEVTAQDPSGAHPEPTTPSRGSRSPAKSRTPTKTRSSESTNTPSKQRTRAVFQSPSKSPRSPVKAKRTYPRVVCMFCVDAKSNGFLNEVKILDGRASVLKKHLATCTYAEPYRKGENPIRPGPPWARAQVIAMRKRAVELMADAKLPASFFERKTFTRFVASLNSAAVEDLPNRKYMGGTGLDEAAAESDELSMLKLEAKQREFQVPVALLSDGWTNIAKTNVLGCQLTLHSCTHTMELLEVGTRHDGVAVAQTMEEIIDNVAKEFKERAKQQHLAGKNEYGAAVTARSSSRTADEDIGSTVKVGACITDNAGQCARARRILALRHPDVIFLHCFAHDVNNLVKQVLHSEFSEIAKRASTAINYLNASTAVWLQHAQGIMQRLYGVTRGFDRLCETRWNSIHDSFTSLLRVRSALEALARDYSDGLPDELAVFSEESFWDNLIEAERIIAPLAAASYRLQRNGATLADVVLMYRNIYYAFAKSIKYGHSLVQAVEGRWAKCEQPMFLVAFFLDPSLRSETAKLLRKDPDLERVLSDAVLYYYRRFFGEGTDHIRDELSEWLSLRSLGVRLSDWEHPFFFFFFFNFFFFLLS